jgi:molybdate/tungstate transport system substrate-binding protein
MRNKPLGLALCATTLASCTARDTQPGDGPLVVWAAASIARPVRAALDTFAARTGTRYQLETQASLELARRITELGQTPDVLLLADRAVFPALLVPAHVQSYALFARNRIVLAYTPRSRGADSIARAGRWWELLERPGVEVGRADPATDPSGYRTLLVFQLLERHYGVPGLARRLVAAAPARNVRPREADQIALLQAAELDYIWTYENLARAAGLPMLTLPDDADLGTVGDSAAYATASVRVPGRGRGDSITVGGEPIVYALAVPRHAPHPSLGGRFVQFLGSADGRRVLRANRLDALDSLVVLP